MDKNNISVLVKSICPDKFRADETIEVKLIACNPNPEIDLSEYFFDCYFLLLGFSLMSKVDSLVKTHGNIITFKE